MSKSIKRALSLLLCAALLFGVAPLNGFVGLELPKLELPGWFNLDWLDFSSMKALAATEYTSGDYTYTLAENSATITKVATSVTGEFEVPAALDEHPVVAIGSKAFENCQLITTVTMPNGVTSIGVSAFNNCIRLATVTLPASVTTIGNYAFASCKSLSSIDLGGVRTLGYRVFNDCPALTSITIPKTLTTADCYSSNFSFAGSSIQTAVIEEGIANIPANLFRECTTLTSVTLPENADTETGYAIGANAFNNCIRLESINLPENLTSIGDNAFANCKNLVELELTSVNTSLSSSAFNGAYVENMKIPAEDSQAALILIDNEIPFTAKETGIKDLDSRNMDHTNSSYYSSSGSVLASKQIPLTVKYAFKPNTKRLVSNLKLIVRIPHTAYLTANSVKVDGATAAYTYNNNVITVNLSKPEGTVTFAVTPEEASYLMTYARMEYRIDNTTKTETIGVLNMATGVFTMNVPTETPSPIVKVSGVTAPEGVVTIYVNNEEVATVTASKTGMYTKSIRIPEAVDGSSYEIMGKTAIGGQEKEMLSYVLYATDAVNVTEFMMYYTSSGGSASIDLVENAEKKPIIVWYLNTSYSFTVKFDNPDHILNCRIGSQKNGETKYLDAVWDDEKQMFVASGFFDPNNRSYVMGTLFVEFDRKINSVFNDASFEDSTSYEEDNKSVYRMKVNVHNEAYPEFFYQEEIIPNVSFVPNMNDDLLSNGTKKVYENPRWQYEEANDFAYYTIHIENNNGSYDEIRRGITVNQGIHSSGLKKAMSAKVATSAKDVAEEISNSVETVADIAKKAANAELNRIKKDKNNTEIINEIEAEVNDAFSDMGEFAKMSIDALPLSAFVKEFINGTIDEAVDFTSKGFKKNKYYRENTEKLLNTAKRIDEIRGDGNTTTYDTIKRILENENEKGVDTQTTSYVRPPRIKHDPSGYVYEAVPSNRLSGVTVTVYTQDESGNAIVWDEAEEYEEVNPLTTDAMGCYAWDVPEGQWQVKAEKDGYETAYSEWLPVPPPQLDVNIGMVSTAAPTVDFVNVYADEIEVRFSQYMDISTINADNVTFTASETALTGSFDPVDAEKNYDGSARYATTFSFIPDKRITDDVQVQIAGVKNYAGTEIAETYSASCSVTAHIQTINIVGGDHLEYRKDGVVTIEAFPAAAAAGKTITITLSNSFVAELDKTEVTLDANGKAEVPIKTLLPGMVEITYSIEGTAISESESLTVDLVPNVDVTGLTLSERTASVKVGQTLSLVATVTPANATYKTVSWSSGNSEVATVDKNGVVTAVAPGSAAIIATAANGRWLASCVVTVTEGKLFTLSYNANGGVGAPTETTGSGTITLASERPTRDGYTFLGWADNAAATTVQYGAGASFNLTQDTTLFAVWQKNETPPTQPKVQSVKLDDVTLNYKDVTVLKPSITADAGVKTTVKYESANPNVAKVDENGTVTGMKRGSTTITCTVTDGNGNTVKDTCKVTVKYTLIQWLIIILLFGWLWY